jgi:hypothetical protein
MTARPAAAVAAVAAATLETEVAKEEEEDDINLPLLFSGHCLWNWVAREERIIN